MQQTNFTRNLGRDGNTTIFVIIEEKRNLDFLQGIVRVL